MLDVNTDAFTRVFVFKQYSSIPGLKQNAAEAHRLANWKNGEIIFKMSANSIVSAMQLLWRYGWSLLSMERKVNRFVKEFAQYVDERKLNASHIDCAPSPTPRS